MLVGSFEDPFVLPGGRSDGGAEGVLAVDSLGPLATGGSPPLAGGVVSPPLEALGRETLTTGVSTSGAPDSSPTDTPSSGLLEEEPPTVTLSNGVEMLSSDFPSPAALAGPAATSAIAHPRHSAAIEITSSPFANALAPAKRTALPVHQIERDWEERSGTSLGEADGGAAGLGAHADLVGQARHEGQAPAVLDFGVPVK